MHRRWSLPFIVLVLIASGCGRASDDEAGESADTTTPPATSADATSTTEAEDESPSGTSTLVEGDIATPDGRMRTYRAHVPAAADAGEVVPVLVALHGGGGSAVQFERASGFGALAATDGVLVVFPDGTGTGRQGRPVRTWNAGQCCGPAVSDRVDDVGFFRQLVAEIDATYEIDATRVVVTGHSNGAAMAYRLACEATDLVTAIGVQAAPLGFEPCTPMRPASVLHIHGSEDRNVPIDGGVGPDGISGVDFWPVMRGIETFVHHDGCATEPDTETTGGDPQLTIQEWAPCDDGTVVELIVVEGAGHGWMATSGSGAMGDAVDVGFSSTETIWEFLSHRVRP